MRWIAFTREPSVNRETVIAAMNEAHGVVRPADLGKGMPDFPPGRETFWIQHGQCRAHTL